MLASQQLDMIRVLDLQGHQQAYCLQRVEPLVNIVSQKYILDCLHLFLVRIAEALENVQKVLEPSVN